MSYVINPTVFDEGEPVRVWNRKATSGDVKISIWFENGDSC